LSSPEIGLSGIAKLALQSSLPTIHKALEIEKLIR
jgi:hypothetical protein